MEGTGAIFTSELSQGSRNYGPRMIVRSIKGIQRGEEVTTTYTDLLQPTVYFFYHWQLLYLMSLMDNDVFPVATLLAPSSRPQNRRGG